LGLLGNLIIPGLSLAGAPISFTLLYKSPPKVVEKLNLFSSLPNYYLNPARGPPIGEAEHKKIHFFKKEKVFFILF
jgi:hypothetical protein